jgi:hypothetical protein
MTRAVLRRLHSPDAPDLATYSPPDRLRFGILVQGLIGPEGEDGEESFDFFVCTPSWLSDALGHADHTFGRHYLFVAEYDYAHIQGVLQQLCNRVCGPDWNTVASILARYGRWEFEDYDAEQNTG